jgi:hypothetical protein
MNIENDSSAPANTIAVVQAVPVVYDPSTVVDISIGGMICTFGPFLPASTATPVGIFILVCGDINTPCAMGELTGANFEYRHIEATNEDPEHYGECPSVDLAQEALTGLLEPTMNK